MLREKPWRTPWRTLGFALATRVAMACASGCGGNVTATSTANPGFNTPNTVQGTFSGQSLSVGSAASTAVIPDSPGSSESYLEISLAADSNICALLVPLTSNSPAFIQIPTLTLRLVLDGGELTGTYPVIGPDGRVGGCVGVPPYAYVDYANGPAGCPGTLLEQAVSGTVTVSRFDEDAGIFGTFDVTMGVFTLADGALGPGNDPITGSFSAPRCDTYTELASPCGGVQCNGIVPICQ